MASKHSAPFRDSNATQCLALLLLFFSWTSPAAPQQKPDEKAEEKHSRIPVLMINRWPGEGIPVIQTGEKTERLLIRSDLADPNSGREARVPSSEKLDWDDTRILILEKGEYEVESSTPQELTLVSGIDDQGRLHYESKGTLALSAGERINVLCYIAEGFYLFERNGQLFEMFAVAEDAGRFLREPEVEWWIHIKQPEQLSGWVLVDGEDIRITERTF